jgi:hypothetical protein
MSFTTKENARGGTQTMFSRKHKRLTYANVTATLALVFAMSGGALAAGKFLITSTKQIKPSVIKQLQGKAGSAGPTGAPGPQGHAGPQGAAGANGKDGAAGANGESIGASEVKAGEAACGKLGGSKFTVGGKETLACNGKEGKAGSPWTAEGTLPVGATETGVWYVSEVVANAEESHPQAPVSFPIPLKEPLGESQAHVVTVAEQKEHTAPQACQGTAAEPTAESGSFCVYIAKLTGNTNGGSFNPVGEFVGGTGATGAILLFGSGETVVHGLGTWAVTG